MIPLVINQYFKARQQKKIRRQLAPWFLIPAAFMLIAGAQASTDTPRHYILWYRNYDSPAIHTLVNLALSKTPEYGEFRVVRSKEFSQGRVLRELGRDNSELIDIANVASSPEREANLTAIPIPVDGGLLGLRVCLIRPESLSQFEGIRTLEDLKNSNIRIGQGAHWPDTEILESNGISVVTHPRYEILFGMLRNNRFECFARGVSEVLYDLEVARVPNVMIEPNLLLAYPMPSFFFVGSKDTELAQRLQLGMERAIYDGSFAVFLEAHFGRSVDLLNLESRNVIVLDNPSLNSESHEIGRRAFENLRRRLEQLKR